MGVVPTAIVPPRSHPHQIVRPHLAKHAKAVDRSRVTTVYAPAGYGKTTAVLQWSGLLERRGRTILWLAARAGIAALDDFADALTVAVAAAGLDQGGTAPGTPIPEAMARLAAVQRKRPVLVIDDAQMLPREVFDLVARIIASAGDTLTTIIVSRSLNVMPIARMRALGSLLEIGPDDLRFSLAETAELVARHGQGPVDTSLLQQLVEDTRGWPAGIAMARAIQYKHWRDGSDQGVPVRPSGLRLEFESYFSEEVMSLQTIEVRNFLVETMVLDELTPAACAAVTGAACSRKMLDHVAESGLFLDAVDAGRQRFRYHPLFREMVLRRLADRDPRRAAALHRRASVHFAAVGDAVRAVEHARDSGDRLFLADQLESLAEPLTYQGRLYLVDALAAGMTNAMLAPRPHLALALAWRRIRSLALEAADALIALAEGDLAARRGAGGGDSPALQHLGLVIEHRRLMCAAARDDMASVERGAEALLRRLGDDHPYLSCSLLAVIIAARRELYRFQDMLKLEAETRRALGRPGADFASIALKASIAPTLAMQGRTDTAEQMLREALAYALSLPGEGIAALPALPLAELLYDRGALEEARDLIRTYLPMARQWGFADQFAAGHIVNARITFNDGNLALALKALDETQLLAIECDIGRLRGLAVGEQVRMLIRSGEPRQARAALMASALMPGGEPYPTMHPSRHHESIAIAWVRVEMQRNRLVQARKVAKRWSEFVRHSGAVRSAVVFELLLAQIAVLAGDRSEARRAVREAVTLAAPANWTRVFLDEGEAIGSLLAEAYGQSVPLDSAPDKFGEKLVMAFRGRPSLDTEEDYGLGSHLVHREIDILRMVGGGLRNREIGNRLGLTEGTVKWYMQQIYDKLGVRRRPQAVTRARQLGVLA